MRVSFSRVDEPSYQPSAGGQSSVQNSAVKRGSLSWTTLSGRPNCLTTPQKNNCATYLALNSPTPKVHAVKTVYFVKQSTQVKIALQPFAQEGSPVIKSIDHDPNLLSAMVKVPVNLGVLMCYPQHIDKPNTTNKLSNKILTSVATTHEQTTKHASF